MTFICFSLKRNSVRQSRNKICLSAFHKVKTASIKGRFFVYQAFPKIGEGGFCEAKDG